MNKIASILLVVIGISLANATPAIFKPLSEELISYVNEASGSTWKVTHLQSIYIVTKKRSIYRCN